MPPSSFIHPIEHQNANQESRKYGAGKPTNAPRNINVELWPLFHFLMTQRT